MSETLEPVQQAMQRAADQLSHGQDAAEVLGELLLRLARIAGRPEVAPDRVRKEIPADTSPWPVNGTCGASIRRRE
jgi:hypothetical protein